MLFLSFMNSHMALQILCISKTQITYFTLEWLFSSMDVHMMLSIDWTTKVVITKITLVIFCCCMNIHVMFKAAFPSKMLITHFALVLFSSCMDTVMIRKTLSLCEGYLTHPTMLLGFYTREVHLSGSHVSSGNIALCTMYLCIHMATIFLVSSGSDGLSQTILVTQVRRFSYVSWNKQDQ